MKSSPLVLLLLAGLAACGTDDASPLPSDPYERWKLRDVHDYTIDQTRSCFCPDGGAAMRLTVRADTLFRVTRISDGFIMPAEQAENYHSVEDLFEIIRTVSMDSLIIRYNEEFGYPEYLDIYPQWHPVDGGELLETGNLRIH